MHVALDILKRDLLALVKNPIALFVVVALLVLPGLYAWYCIVANWDPYSNTGGMPIAVVNNDKGAKTSLTGEVNIGEQVVEKLEANDSIDWRFYDDEEKALEDTKFAIVYATLVLPEDLSENLVGIFEGSDDKPTIYYYPNEKYSAVATKVTDSAAQTLIRQINQGFSSTVNQKVLESTQKISNDVESKADQANKSATAEMKSIQDDLDKVIASLDDAASAIEGWRRAASGADSALAATQGQLPTIAAALSQGSDQVNALREKTDAFESNLSATILKSASAISTMSGKAVTVLNNATADLKAAASDLKAAEKVLEPYKELEELVEGLEAIVNLIEGTVEGVDARVAEMDANVQDTTNSVTNATNQISGEVMPQISTGSYELAMSLSKLSGAIVMFEPQVANLRDVLSQTNVALDTASASIADAKTMLNTISKNLKSTSGDIGAIGKALEIDQLSELLNVDPDNVGTFISSPVQMVTEKIYPVSNYGTAVAPFYTNLALWIGCFILVSLMKVEVTGYPQATARQRYFGRWLLFVILSLLQSQAICGVDILLGIDCAHPALFMLSGAVCSFAYMNLIYALVKTFRNIGRTLCIFLLIMQVPGSSGMYPIQMMPEFFQFIHPSLPFTYGINAMREALCGMNGLTYVRDLLVVLLIVPGSLLIGLGLRPIMANLLLMFDEEMNKAGFFASEEYEEGMETEGVRGMIRALAAQGRYADDIEERAWRFNRTYPRWRRLGSIVTFVIPFALLVIVFPFNLAFSLSSDVKITALVVMLVVLLIVQVALIVLEYTHRSIVAETKLVAADILGDDWDLAELMGDDAPTHDNAPASGMVPATGKLFAKSPHGGPARDIFITDITLGFQSVIGVVVIILLVITPAMYAWFNIAGSWDPYSSTGNLKVAVANEDQGYKGDLVPVTINIGDTLVSQLRGNSSFDWVFVDKEEAIAGVQESRYYAAIEIPSDFSANMLTYLTDDADYPNVVYYTNEKENPIAPIITQKGADSIQENIRVSFTERIDEVVLGVSYDVLNYIKKPSMSSYVTTMSKHLDDATGDTKTASREVRSLSGLLRTTSGIIDTLGVTLDGLKGAGSAAKEAIGDAKSGADNATAAFDRALGIVREMLNGHGPDVEKIKTIIDTALDILYAGASTVPDAIQERIDRLEEISKIEGLSDEAKRVCNTLIERLTTAKEHAIIAVNNISEAKGETDALITDAQVEVNDAKAFFDGTVAPSIDELHSTLSTATTSASEVVAGLEGAIAGIDDSTGGLSNQLSSLSSGLAKAADKLEGAAKNIEDTKQRVSNALKSGDLKQIEDVIMGGDPEAIAASLAAPIEQKREPVYAVSNFGSAMSSFYTVLSLWVGALVMISAMRVHVVEERIEELRQRYGRVRPRHEFFGRYGIFGFIGLLQSSLVLLGDLLLLHIQCDNPVMFFLCGVFIGQMFCLIVYTITELFGDVGKALCVILLIMQVAASGGTFPPEMLHPILLNVVSFLPFYHAMTILQECVAGILWPSLVVHMLVLIVMVVAILIIGLPLRRPFRRLNTFFEEQLEKTGYM